MKKLFTKLAILGLSVVAACCMLAGCSSGTACLGVWSMQAGTAVYANLGDLGYNPIASYIAESSCDSVTLFDDDTYIWTTVYTFDYTSDGVNWTHGLAYQTLTFYGTYTMTENTDLEEYELTIVTVDRFVGEGTNYNCDTDNPSGEDGDTADDAAIYLARFKTCLTTGTYSLSMNSSLMTGNYVFVAMLGGYS